VSTFGLASPSAPGALKGPEAEVVRPRGRASLAISKMMPPKIDDLPRRVGSPMIELVQGRPAPPFVNGVATLHSPTDPDFLNLWHLWETKRGTRLLPSRSDFDPTEFKALLPDTFLLDVLPSAPHYRFRLMGENVVSFHGRSFTGKTFEQCFEPPALTLLTALFDAFVEGRVPIFRAGNAYWWSDQSYKTFESCYFPLSADVRVVNMVLGAIRFPPT
jgi:hypothetical protein